MTTTATERVGRYQLLEPIGHGPSGKVSRAKVFGVAGFERQFAVKRFHSELTSGQQAQALSTAARAYGGLEHPRIARMSEFGIAQGTTYTAVEYVAGLDAMRLITEVKLGGAMLAAGGALALVSQAARAVGYAHGRGLTHLGLSPTNVVITAEGDVKITDFGILAATLPPRPIEVARLAHRIGYLAPEQLTNEATSAATDVFALGVLAYELITGNRTFAGDNAGQIAKAVTGGPPADPPLPKAILRVLQRCLARSPFERFPDARALADALDAALRVAPVPGTRKDIGAQVRSVLDRLAEVHSGELSGMLSLDVGTANLGPAGQVASLGNAQPVNRDSQVEVATMEFVRPDTHVAGPTPLSGPKPSDDDPSEADIDAAFAEDDKPLPTMPAKPTTIAAREPIGVKPVVKIPEIPKFGVPKPTEIPKPRTMTPSPVRAGAATPPPLPVVKQGDDDSGSTRPQMIKAPMTTVAGLAPPPIPMPPGAVTSPSKHRADSEGTPGTLLGVGRSQIPRPLVGAVPPPKPGQGPTRPVGVQLDGPQDRPSESPVSPLRMMDGAPSGAAPAVPLAKLSPTKAMADSKRQLFGALRPDTDSADAPRTDLVIETDPGEVFEFQGRVDPAIAGALVPEGASLSVEMEIVHPPSDVELPPDDDMPIRPELLGAQPGRRPEPAIGPAERPTNEMSPLLRDELATHSSRPSDELAAWRPKSLDDLSTPNAFKSGPPMSEALIEAQPPERKTLAGFEPSRSLTAQRPNTPSAAFSQQPERNLETMDVRSLPPKRSTASWIIASILGVCVLGAIAYVVYDLTQGDSGSASAPVDAKQVAAIDAAALKPADATEVAPADTAVIATTVDAAGKAAVDAAPAPADAPAITPTGGGDTLSITSTPAGAHIYLDGAESGVTPLKLPGSPDKHNIALLLAGHELYVAKGAAGAGTLAVTLKEVSPPGGPAGIKVLKCKDTNRYYVTVDGKQTGMMCPTERIEVNVGDHTIEVYDAVTESVKSFPVSVKDTRLSVRVRVEP